MCDSGGGHMCMLWKWRIICCFWSRGKICLAKRRWTLTEPRLAHTCKKPFEDLSTHKPQTHIANTSQYSLHSCLIAEDWSCSEHEKRASWKKEHNDRQIETEGNKRERTCCTLSLFFLMVPAVRNRLGLLDRYLSYDWQRTFMMTGEEE